MYWVPISHDPAKTLVALWRARRPDGALRHDFTYPDGDTRFLGDLYQDLSEAAKKTYALLQTPRFIASFILDRTLTPAIEEFGLDSLRLIDPACGSDHFLLDAFGRLVTAWREQSPSLDDYELARRALDSVHGVAARSTRSCTTRSWTPSARCRGSRRRFLSSPRSRPRRVPR